MHQDKITNTVCTNQYKLVRTYGHKNMQVWQPLLPYTPIPRPCPVAMLGGSRSCAQGGARHTTNAVICEGDSGRGAGLRGLDKPGASVAVMAVSIHNGSGLGSTERPSPPPHGSLVLGVT